MHIDELKEESYSKNKEVCDTEYQKAIDSIKEACLQGMISVNIKVSASEGVGNNVAERLKNNGYEIDPYVFYHEDGMEFTIWWKVY